MPGSRKPLINFHSPNDRRFCYFHGRICLEDYFTIISNNPLVRIWSLWERVLKYILLESFLYVLLFDELLNSILYASPFLHVNN